MTARSGRVAKEFFLKFMMFRETIVTLVVISPHSKLKLLSKLTVSQQSNVNRSTFSISPTVSRVCFAPSAPGKDSSPEDDGKTIDSSLGFLW